MKSIDSRGSSLGICCSTNGTGSSLDGRLTDAELINLEVSGVDKTSFPLRDSLLATISIPSSAKLASLGCAKLAARLAVLLAWQRDLRQLLPGFSCTSSTAAGAASLTCLLMGGATGLINIRLASCIVSVVARWCSSSWAVRDSREVVGLGGGDGCFSGERVTEGCSG